MCIAGYKLRLYEAMRLLEARRGKKGKKYEEIRPYVATWGLDVATWGLDVATWGLDVATWGLDVVAW